MEYKYKIILFIFLAVVTIACHTCVEQYTKTGPEMLSDHWSVYGSHGSKGEIKQNELFLFSPELNKSINIQQDLPFFEHGSILRLSADMKCENVQPGTKTWDRARLLLVQNDGQKDRWNLPHWVASIYGFRDWDTYEEAFIVQPETKYIRVVAQLSNCLGTFQLKNIQLYPVVQTRGYTWTKKGVLLSWSLFGIFLLVAYILNGSSGGVLRIWLALSFIVIIIGTSVPSKVRNQASIELTSQLQKSNDVFEHVLPKNLHKIGHFAFFALFTLLLSLLLKQTPFFVVLLNLLMVAGGTELAQFFIDGRAPLFTDFLIDTTGGLTGLGLCLLFKNHFPKQSLMAENK